MRYNQLQHAKKLLLGQWKLEKYNGNTTKINSDTDIKALLESSMNTDSGHSERGASTGTRGVKQQESIEDREHTRQRILEWKAAKARKLEEAKVLYVRYQCIL